MGQGFLQNYMELQGKEFYVEGLAAGLMADGSLEVQEFGGRYRAYCCLFDADQFLPSQIPTLGEHVEEDLINGMCIKVKYGSRGGVLDGDTFSAIETASTGSHIRIKGKISSAGSGGVIIKSGDYDLEF